MKVVLIDPRRTMTADIADLHLPIRPDGDVALFVGLLKYLAASQFLDRPYIAAHTTGFDDAIRAASSVDADTIARQTGLNAEILERFFALFAATERPVTVFSQGVNQSASGTDKVNAIINCHLATGRIAKPGMGPFSVTGQPNAMGGREVGGLANALAAHMAIENPEHRDRVQRFWRSPMVAAKPGVKAVDMFRAVGDGRIKALWIMATNPAVSMPDVGAVEAAIKSCPFVVVSDVVAATDTIRHAHVRLPAAAWGEKNGTVTNSERCISRQRPFLPLPGEARPDWWIISEIGKRMGFADAFAYDSPSKIFAEHAALSAFENEGTRDFDIGAYSWIDDAAFDRLAPFQWPCPENAEPRERLFADGKFFTSDRKARFVSVVPRNAQRASPALPLTLNTGRVRDHWHTLTRTGNSARLSQHFAEPYAELHPQDASRYKIGDADLVRVSTKLGDVIVRALISPRQQHGSIFVPMHWTGQFAASARIDTVIPSVTDALSGQPASKNTAVAIERFNAATYGFAVLTRKPADIDAEYWAIAKCNGGWRVELAFANPPHDWAAFAAALFDTGTPAHTITFQDTEKERYRFVVYDGPRLIGALFLASEPVVVARDWVVQQFAAAHLNDRPHPPIIAGRPGAGALDKGATVCSCFGVGANEIALAVNRGCRTVTAIGEALQAGTNCGSCRAEIQSIIAAPAT
jgi:assimilatory nitrate reductase catalytic subunit